MTPLGAVARGLLSGVVGTAAMDTALFVRYRRGGGASSPEEWEVSEALSSWDDAPAPAQVGKRLIEGLFQVELPPARAKPLWKYDMKTLAQDLSAHLVHGLATATTLRLLTNHAVDGHQGKERT